jgi:predicted chitinase
LQSYARKNGASFNTLGWIPTLKPQIEQNGITAPPADRVFISGCGSESTKLVFATQYLLECFAKEVISFLTIIHLILTINADVIVQL